MIEEHIARNFFVFIGVGEEFRRRVAVSARILRKFTQYPVIVIDVEGCSSKEYAMLLKTQVYKYVPITGNKFCYLDSDIIATSSEVDEIFNFPTGSFVIDHVNCNIYLNYAFQGTLRNNRCFRNQKDSVFTLMHDIFDVKVDKNWQHANGGLFLFDENTVNFLEHWNNNVKKVIKNGMCPKFDQVALIATEWQRGEQNKKRLPIKFNFLIDDTDDKLEKINIIQPCFVHFYRNFGDVNFKHWLKVLGEENNDLLE